LGSLLRVIGCCHLSFAVRMQITGSMLKAQWKALVLPARLADDETNQ